jgi:Mg/Co/Ni transporter MgtE
VLPQCSSLSSQLSSFPLSLLSTHIRSMASQASGRCWAHVERDLWIALFEGGCCAIICFVREQASFKH